MSDSKGGGEIIATGCSQEGRMQGCDLSWMNLSRWKFSAPWAKGLDRDSVARQTHWAGQGWVGGPTGGHGRIQRPPTLGISRRSGYLQRRAEHNNTSRGREEITFPEPIIVLRTYKFSFLIVRTTRQVTHYLYDLWEKTQFQKC